MKVYTDQNGCIKSMTPVEGLTEVIINDENNPLENFSDAKKCCYRITVSEGIVTMMTPYKDSRWLDTVDMLGKLEEENSTSVFDLADLADENSTGVFELADAIGEQAEINEDFEARIKALEEGS